MSNTSTNDCWFRKYEPKKLDDMILSRTMKQFTKGIMDRNGISNPILLHGRYGHGKTSYAKLLIRLLKLPNLVIGGGSDDGKGYVKNEIMRFLNTKNNEKKILLTDEFDRFSKPAMELYKPLISSTGRSCSYIFTTNYIEKIPTAITESRVQLINMMPKPEEVKEYETDIIKRLLFIMKNEGYTPTKDDIPILKQLVSHVQYYNIRKMILLMQTQLEFEGKLTNRMFEEQTDIIYEIIDAIKSNNLLELHKKIMEVDVNIFMKFFFDNVFTIFKEEHQLAIAKLMGEYNFTIPMGIDPKIGVYGLCCELIILNNKHNLFG